jgi:hypothetical protein
MLARKTLMGLVIAGLSASALAQQSDAGKTDIFGRPYVNQSPTQIYYQADPFAPLPQFEQIRRAEREAAAGTSQAATPSGQTDVFGRPQLNQSANEVYFNADPFAPLPQLQSLYRSRVLAGLAPAEPVVASKTDIFGRPYTGWDGQEAYYDINPFAPLPQFWNRDVHGVGAVASKPGDTKVSTKAPGSKG